MKEFKGTPGKWIAILEDGRNSHDIIVDREDYSWIASVHQQFHDVATVEQAEANAKLIAAAPELLEALQLLINDLQERGVNMQGDAIKIANEAINKAIS